MRKSFAHLDGNRVKVGEYASQDGDRFGAFVFYNGELATLCIVDDGTLSGWEHVSVSLKVNIDGIIKECTPSWNLMCEIKKSFWEDEECVMQLHPPKSEYVNNCKSCLHLWKPIDQKIPTPPKHLV